MSSRHVHHRADGRPGGRFRTVRYYLRRGLIERPPKPLSGYRRYAAEMVDRIRFIKRAQGRGIGPSQ